MVFKMSGMSLKLYFKDSFNIFDCVIVTFSTIDLMLTYLNINSGGAISALRAFRLLRVFKLAKTWKKF